MDARSYGVSRLALVPVRKEPDDRTEQITQLLFGDHYEVLNYSANGQWLYIKIFTDAYEGWIDRKQHHSITPEYFNQINHANFKITTDLTAGILYKKNPITILLGSIVPISNSELFKLEEQFAFNGEAKSLGQKREFEFLKSIALKYLQAPYQWGGKSPFGVDCSGFTQMVYKINGYSISRDAHQQAGCGRLVASLQSGLPGDLVYFYNESGNIGHVGIILEDHRIIHASGRVKIDQLTEEGIVDLESNVITHRFAGIRRILINN
ncbi:MAG TPA: C40 family peptidase [Cyclobacteriaceae bacterium]|nr:C40 family peptidase [Cyclobacteriaceae bacterium]